MLAGSDFACGKPRLQGFIAMAALDLSIVCVSMPFKMLRRAVARAIPVSVGANDPQAIIAETGDELEIDFAACVVRNLARGTTSAIPPIPPIPPILSEIVASGGTQAALADWLARHPEQAGTTVA